MKPPARNTSASLRGQTAPGRADSKPTVTGLKGYSPSLIVPGEGRSEKAPGADRISRCAAQFADALGSKVGG